MKTHTKISDFFPEGYEPTPLQRQFAETVINYRKAGIDIEPLEWEEAEDGFNNGVTKKVKISQTRLINGYILNQKQLHERARRLYQLIGRKVKVIPVVYSLQVNDIDLHWINAKMEEFGIKRNDLIKQLAIDKSSLSLIFSGNTNLSARTKATFFYYFLTYELNRDLRDQIN